MTTTDTLRLRVLIVAATDMDASFATKVLADHGDASATARDVPDALGALSRDRYDAALVSLSLPRGDGLALIHHLRALHPDLDVIVMTAPSEMEEGAHAMALGVLSNVMLPLTGDALLVAMDRVRERRALILERSRLSLHYAASRRWSATYGRCAAFVAETDLHAVAARVLDACVGELPCQSGAIYVPETPGASRLPRLAATGDVTQTAEELWSDQVRDLDPTEAVKQLDNKFRIVLFGEMDVAAIVDLIPLIPDEVGTEVKQSLEVVAALGTAAFAAARKVDAIARAGIKDPETSAYTFAYFGDVAGREIDRAARQNRRFALLTLSIQNMEQLRSQLSVDAAMQVRRVVADAVLESVRDSDVLARVEDDEFYLLLPETGLLGALACRRRIHESLIARTDLQRHLPQGMWDPVVGIAVYPSDGNDLGKLLRVSRRRTERAREGTWRSLHLAKLPFWDAIDTLLNSKGSDEPSSGAHVRLSPELLSRIGRGVAEDALRQGVAGTLYVSGDATLANAVTRALDPTEKVSIRTWVLGSHREVPEPLQRFYLPVDDTRMDERVLLFSLTELGGYILAGRRSGPGSLLGYHASELDLADGLVASLQTTYHLQPEIR